MVSQPSPPDPYATAAAQNQQNQQASQYSSAASNANEINPYGTVSYNAIEQVPIYSNGQITGYAPRYQRTTTLSPDQQKLMGLETQSKYNMGTVGVEQSAKLREHLNANQIDPKQWAAWQDQLDRGRILVGAAEAERVYGTTIDAPPPVVWDWVTSPGRRLQWQYGVTGIAEETGAAGRRGVGTVTHCVHGPTAIVEEVLDWRPYDYVTYRSQFPVPGSQPIVDTFAFADDGAGGTRLELRLAKPRSAKQRALLEPLLPGLDESIEQGMATLRRAVAADMAARAAAAAVAVPEPAVPESEGRNVREPVARSA